MTESQTALMFARMALLEARIAVLEQRGPPSIFHNHPVGPVVGPLSPPTWVMQPHPSPEPMWEFPANVIIGQAA